MSTDLTPKRLREAADVIEAYNGRRTVLNPRAVPASAADLRICAARIEAEQAAEAQRDKRIQELADVMCEHFFAASPLVGGYRGKKVPRKVGMKPEQRDGIEYECHRAGGAVDVSSGPDRSMQLADSWTPVPSPKLADPESDLVRDALTRRCEICKAPPGEPCTGLIFGRLVHLHRVRVAS